MKSYKLYLPPKWKNDIDCQRWVQLFKEIDREYQEVRTYIVGLDISLEEQPNFRFWNPPFATLDDERIEFEDLYTKVMILTGKSDE